ncbi:MAG: hypothetical protein A3G34_05480 [Candidatus Lindowbacteria bacterium RIFCSPLOWO2_12_FULL_62_27]|nr:MAG: hypothetical protein A3G34_05480 [Candidatus Lindowbacteria bacterium RIFCSPLOWO2_12_FULL_62_27]OGH63763.1 MAG: hypothetical protein A3I06_10725 [Candidatus Lindowbacteria bacterium RIFCSPLOWO2_02_FULL_62_12]
MPAEILKLKDKDKEAINLSAFQQEEKHRRRIQIRQRRVRRDARQVEVYIRLHEFNRYNRVYQMLAFDKIIKDIALSGSVGNVAFELLDRPGAEKAVKMIIDHPEMNALGIQEKIEMESKIETHEFTLYKAMAMMDEVKISSGKHGGIQLEVTKNLRSR